VAQAQYDRMIAQQEQANKLSSDLSGKLSTLISSLKTINPSLTSQGSLQQSILGGGKEEKRHGAVPPYLLAKP
jgi:hypothetical protein